MKPINNSSVNGTSQDITIGHYIMGIAPSFLPTHTHVF